jgi:hypothetical protein
MPRPRRPPHDEDVGVAVAAWCGAPLGDAVGVVELRAGHPTPRPSRPEQSDDVAGAEVVDVAVDVDPVGSPPPPPPPSRPPEPPPSKPPPPPPPLRV